MTFIAVRYQLCRLPCAPPARPRPLEVVAAQPARDVHRFADDEQARHGLGFHRSGRQTRSVDAAERDLGLDVAFCPGGDDGPSRQSRGCFGQETIRDVGDLAAGPPGRQGVGEPVRKQPGQNAPQRGARPLGLGSAERGVGVQTGQQVQHHGLALAPGRGDLQDRRAREPAMGEQHRLAKRSPAAACLHRECDAAEWAHQGDVVVIGDQRHQSRPNFRQRETEPARCVIGKAGRAQLRDGEPARCQHQRGGGEVALVRLDREGIGSAEPGDAIAEAQIHPADAAFLEQHGDDLARRAVAEQLAQRLLVAGDAVPGDQGAEILGGVLREGGAGEMRIGGEEALRRGSGVGEITASAAGDQDLAARLVGVVEQQHPAAPLPGRGGAHQAGRPGPDHDHVVPCQPHLISGVPRRVAGGR